MDNSSDLLVSVLSGTQIYNVPGTRSTYSHENLVLQEPNFVQFD